jgi:hypothetical protein
MKIIEKICMWYLIRRHYRVYQPKDNTPAFVREMRGAK